jgi:hypothetical protein
MGTSQRFDEGTPEPIAAAKSTMNCSTALFAPWWKSSFPT